MLTVVMGEGGRVLISKGHGSDESLHGSSTSVSTPAHLRHSVHIIIMHARFAYPAGPAHIIVHIQIRVYILESTLQVHIAHKLCGSIEHGV